jgi:UDP-N-acetylmuramoyl-L-alanyl-D-glutamate--2,6-diaminopimelate ligase
MGFEFQKIADVLGEIGNVPGRMDVVRQEGFPLVVVDYAHTPDALEKALLALREHMLGKVWCVFGCGGDRDSGKRPQMGEVASRLADHVVITNDNPRGENPQSIANDISKGIRRKVFVELSRVSAIQLAIESADVDDVVLIAGKGHENYQEIDGEKRPYSDFAVVKQCFSAAGLE